MVAPVSMAHSDPMVMCGKPCVAFTIVGGCMEVIMITIITITPQYDNITDGIVSHSPHCKSHKPPYAGITAGICGRKLKYTDDARRIIPDISNAILITCKFTAFYAENQLQNTTSPSFSNYFKKQNNN